MKETNFPLIRYKYIEDERTEDAPFIGALICAVGCEFNCKNCFNQEWRNSETLTQNPERIIIGIKSNPFNEGIIFSGLEWTNQPEELRTLLRLAKYYGLKTCLHTGLDSIKQVEEILDFKFLDFLKIGKYNNLLGGLESPLTNQKFYAIIHTEVGKNDYLHQFIDITHKFQKRGSLK